MKKRFTEIIETNLLKRLVTVEDVANATMFYTSELSSYISGTTLYVDGIVRYT